MSKHKRPKRKASKQNEAKESGRKDKRNGSQAGSVIPYTEHRCFEPKLEQTKHIEWRAKEAAMWAGKCILRLNELRASTVGSIAESDSFSEHYCAAVEAIFRDEKHVKKKFYELIETLEEAANGDAVSEVMLQVSLLFMGHDGLIVGFEYFLPQELTMIMLLVQQKAAIGAAIASDPQCLNRLPELHKQIDNAVRNAVNQFKELSPKEQDDNKEEPVSESKAEVASPQNAATVAGPGQQESSSTQAQQGVIVGQMPAQGGVQQASQGVQQGGAGQPQAQQAPMILQAISGGNTGQVYFMSQPGNQMTLGYAIPSTIQYVQQIPGQNQQFITYGAPATGQPAQQYTNGMQFTTQGQQQQPQVQYVFAGNSAQMFATNATANSSQQQQTAQPAMTQLPTAIGAPQAQFMPQAFTIIQTPAATGDPNQPSPAVAQFSSSTPTTSTSSETKTG